MPRTHLTDISIRSLKPHDTQVTYWDDALPSFGCRVNPGGTKTFTVMYGDDRKRVTIGRYPIVSLSQARARAKEILAEITLGTHGSTITFEAALDLFVKTHCEPNNRASTAYETERLLRRHFLPKLRSQSLQDIATPDVARLIDALLTKPSECNHAFTAVRTFFKWATRRGYLRHSPCEGLQRPTKPTSRSRVLSDDELRCVFKAAGRLGTYGAIVQLLVLTGQRLGEIAGLRAEYVEAKQQVITLPPELTKNGREHPFPYGSMVAAILEPLPKTGLLFPTQTKRHVPFNNWSNSKHEMDKACKVADWTLHDLRRTFATNLAALNAPLHVVEKLLNHVSGTISGVAAIYNRHAYEQEMRDAVTAWEGRLTAILVGS
ncbi:MAG TPA: tyrosine-type recombinase/integrase [Candidatus Cybelea sp.]|nr:tyrosine-type recombinase/integrase [Candidatus Cybelea sp.]